MERGGHSLSPWLGKASHEPAPYTVATVVKSISLMITVCAGAVENTILIYTIIKDKRLHKAPYYFIVNLSVGDLTRSVLCLPLVLDSVLHGSVWKHSIMGCKLLAFSSTFLTFGTTFAIFILAIDRYLSVVYHRFHARKLRGAVTCLLIVLLGWAIAFLLAFPPVFGLGTYSFNPLEGQCTFDHRFYTDNDTLAFTVIFLAVLVISASVYIRIFHFLRGHRKMYPVIHQAARSTSWAFHGPRGNMNNLTNAGMVRTNTNTGLASPPATLNPLLVQTPSQCVANRYYGNSMVTYQNEHLTRAAFIVTSLFVVLWLPYNVVSLWYMFDPNRNIPWLLVTIATWMTYSQVAIVPMVYIFYHKPFRRSMSDSISYSPDPQAPGPYTLVEIA